MSSVDVAPDPEDAPFQNYPKDESTETCQYSPRSRTTLPTAAHLFLPDSRTFLPFRRTPFAQKGRLSSSFCFALLVFTTSLVFVQLIFLTSGVVTYTPVICDSSYEADSADAAHRIQQKAMLAENARLRFPRTKRRLPQCIIIGARKCGTRALLEFLNLHPMIQKATEEIHFFDDDEKYALGLDWYRRRMPYSFPGQITVEKSPAYFITPSVPERIRQMNPSVKLLLIVRDPVTRLISDYAQLASNKARKERSLASFEDLVLTADGSVNLGYKAVRIGMYSLFFPRWLRTFPREQIHIVDGDNLIVDPFHEIQKIEDFLGLGHRVMKKNFYYNETKGFFCVRNATADKCLNDSKGRKHPNVSSEVIRTLRMFYGPHNQHFFRQAGVTFNWPVE
ncbi:heparan sulfate glucosamine 3-O-sulfotransferase 1-like [Argiope bruennichi]|uniref:heparan sulfate glucosamine 3-O-sulfotransferase 1-like n=1 Tax=Argiope bruennichi TaxID=94029 RepID=UPI0024951848|nr:heparan sulfate glucosamine 3-O-sulfotransferase 1-like [Argiope bruennichi]XP_055934069.1 heparan sulfate glucosamine 3-O-sulfotransferase 1-like [Argiope bruennichi]XP_055934071.1 heparan sulfate glucosamine 3-O-sulfotransferase 1-like [Argiope bruennichi]XP_055934072.1 heparan sulfate glucosamine 3-O-sulfotransferase 1-like [Argiope bruennichi]XP_055934073.1 heparan sulfate glucosamine 3-O-sulfotransferase 1-like [Argiope bruennichi]